MRVPTFECRNDILLSAYNARLTLIHLITFQNIFLDGGVASSFSIYHRNCDVIFIFMFGVILVR